MKRSEACYVEEGEREPMEVVKDLMNLLWMIKCMLKNIALDGYACQIYYFKVLKPGKFG